MGERKRIDGRNAEKTGKRYFGSLDVATMAILACATGVSSAYIASFTIWAGFFGFWYEELFQGLFMVFLILAGYMVRKPGAGIITGTISGFIEFIAGNPLGVVIIPYGIIEGLGVDVGFSLFRYKRFDMLSFFVAGGMWFLTIPYTVYAFGMEWMPLTTPILWAVFIIFQILSGGIFGGLISLSIARVLDKSGLTERYVRISRSSK